MGTDGEGCSAEGDSKRPIYRKRPAHGVQIWNGVATIVVVTVCTRNRERWLACEDAHQLLLTAWNTAQAWRVGRYVLMPDHLHLFCSPVDLNITLDNWVRYWKTRFHSAVFSRGWKLQSNHWDTRLRRRAI